MSSSQGMYHSQPPSPASTMSSQGMYSQAQGPTYAPSQPLSASQPSYQQDGVKQLLQQQEQHFQTTMMLNKVILSLSC